MEASLVEVSLSNVGPAEVCSVGISLSQARLYIWMLQSPLIPRDTPFNEKFTEVSLFRSIVLNKWLMANFGER